MSAVNNSESESMLPALAERFYATHGGLQLACDEWRLLALCAEHLQQLRPVYSQAECEAAAQQGWSAWQDRNRRAWVDIDHSTNQCVVLNDTASGQRYRISVDMLLAAVERFNPQPFTG